MAAVITSAAGAPALQGAVSRLRSDFGVPADKVMSWKEHVKNHDRRKHAASVLLATPGFQVCYVYAAKSELRAGTYRDDPKRFYNYVAFKTYTTALWGAAYGLNSYDVSFRFGHVRGHDHRPTKQYIQREARRNGRLPDTRVKSLKWVSADRYVESQAADLFGGFLKAATWPSGEFNFIEPSYLQSVWPRIRNSDKCAVPLGIMSMPRDDVLTGQSWFPCTQCKKVGGS